MSGKRKEEVRKELKKVDQEDEEDIREMIALENELWGYEDE